MKKITRHNEAEWLKATATKVKKLQFIPVKK